MHFIIITWRYHLQLFNIELWNIIFINALLLFTLTIVLAFTSRPLDSRQLNSFTYRIVCGIILGVLGLIMLLYSWILVDTHYIVSLCFIVLILSYYIGGFVTSQTTLVFLVINVYILSLHIKLLNRNNILTIFIFYSFVFLLLSFIRLKYPLKKKVIWFTLLSISIIMNEYLFYSTLPESHHIYNIQTLIFHIFYIVSGILEFRFITFLLDLNTAFRVARKASTTDFLTHLCNTRHFESLYTSISNMAETTNSSLSCLMLDLDHFKSINDTYGHGVGDIVLKEIADVFLSTASDANVIGRVGGEEFCILIDQNIEQAVLLAEKIRAAVEKHPLKVDRKSVIFVTVSIGIANYPNTTTACENLKSDADKALYVAKRTGRNKFSVYESTTL